MGFLSGLIICQNEESLIERAIDQIINSVDELIVVDGGSTDCTVDKIKSLNNSKISVFYRKFDGHFGDQKNFGISRCRCKWVFNLDADEELEKGLIENPESLKKIILDELEICDEIGCFKLARINKLDGQDTLVYPDFQSRLFRQCCRFIYPVHEELVGFRKFKEIDEEGYRILHNKTFEKQLRQNNDYVKLIMHYRSIIPSYILNIDKEK